MNKYENLKMNLLSRVDPTRNHKSLNLKFKI